MKLIYIIPFVFFISCAESEPGDSGTQNFEATDSIKEFDMNENRLSAVDFNNEMTLMQERTLDLVFELFQSDSASVDLNLENTNFELDVNIQTLDLTNPPDGAEEFVRTMKNVMRFYKDELQGKFLEMVPLIKQKELTKKQKDDLKNYDVYFAEQEKIWFDSVFVEQEKFAKANNIKLEE